MYGSVVPECDATLPSSGLLHSGTSGNEAQRKAPWPHQNPFKEILRSATQLGRWGRSLLFTVSEKTSSLCSNSDPQIFLREDHQLQSSLGNQIHGVRWNRERLLSSYMV
jgi:hypothetical protein